MRVLAVATALALGLVACSREAPAGRDALDLGVSGRINANPTLVADGELLALAWSAATAEGATDVYVSVSRDGGSTFSEPVRANDARSRASLSGEQPPRLALVRRPMQGPAIVAVWTVKAEGGTRLVSAESTDGGRTFAPPAIVAGTEAPGNRGWETIASDRTGGVVSIWLDHRELAADGAGMTHAGHAAPQQTAEHNTRGDGAARAQLSKLFFGRVGDPASVVPVTGGVCYCCKTALTTGADGSIYAAWRHVYPGNRRDIAFAMSRDDGRTFSSPVRVSEDDWELDGCPENGPALAVDGRGRAHIVWPTLITESGRETLALFHATSRDGRTFTPRVRIPTSAPAYHPQLALTASGDLVVAWDEPAGGVRHVRFARADAGPDAPAFRRIDAVATGTYPTLTVVGDRVLAAWTRPGDAGSRIAVQVLPF